MDKPTNDIPPVGRFADGARFILYADKIAALLELEKLPGSKGALERVAVELLRWFVGRRFKVPGGENERQLFNAIRRTLSADAIGYVKRTRYNARAAARALTFADYDDAIGYLYNGSDEERVQAALHFGGERENRNQEGIYHGWLNELGRDRFSNLVEKVVSAHKSGEAAKDLKRAITAELKKAVDAKGSAT